MKRIRSNNTHMWLIAEGNRYFDCKHTTCTYTAEVLLLQVRALPTLFSHAGQDYTNSWLCPVFTFACFRITKDFSIQSMHYQQKAEAALE